ncbi:MAG: hypothetical protein K2Q03_00750 [Sphingobacteriaceae bacterium]|nr:hypothetical protein [Sphingobacteriaceae bacterium]
MIDNIVMMKRNLSAEEIKKIVATSRLLEYNTNGLKEYHNGKMKNLTGGVYVKIYKNKSVKISGSLHKYATYLREGKLNNFDTFTMQQARQTIDVLIESIGIEPKGLSVTEYEVGINMNVDIEPIKILEGIKSIGLFENEKPLYNNPKYKNESVKTTVFHKDLRVYYKIYDKIHEMKDKRKQAPSNPKIIRIETTTRRVENTFVVDFFEVENLDGIQKKFFKAWDNLNFYKDVDAPKGTHKGKMLLAKDLINKGKTEVMNEYIRLYKSNRISMKIYYPAKKFIENWDTERLKFKVKTTDIFTAFKNTYMFYYQGYSKNTYNDLTAIDKKNIVTGAV